MTPTQETRLKRIAIICAIIGMGVLIFFIIRMYQWQPVAPNEKLNEYLESQRRVYDSTFSVYEAQVIKYIKSAELRHIQDSIEYADALKNFNREIHTIKQQYEKIPSYTDLSKDSIRRLLSEKFPE